MTVLSMVMMVLASHRIVEWALFYIKDGDDHCIAIVTFNGGDMGLIVFNGGDGVNMAFLLLFIWW